MSNRLVNLQRVRVRNFTLLDVMRQIYNDNLEKLSTICLPHRSKADQETWWKLCNKQIRAYLYELNGQPGKYIGFVTLTDRGEFTTHTIALTRDYWGMGYGTQIMLDYMHLARKPLAASQLASNIAMRNLHAKLGWLVVGKADGPMGEVELIYHPGMSRKNPGTEHSKEVVTAYLIDKYQGYAI